VGFAVSISAIFGVALLSPWARAQVDPRLIDPSLSPGAVIGLDTAWIPGHLQRWAGVGIGLADDELISDGPDGAATHAPLHTRWISTIAFGLGLFDRLELQIGVPLHLVSGPTLAGDDAVESFGVGDVRLAMRAALLRPEMARGGLGVSLQAALFLPTGSKAPMSGDEAAVFDPRVVVDWRGDDGVGAALHLGYRARPERRVLDLTIDDEVRLGAALELPLGALGSELPVSLLAEVEAAIGLGEARRRSALFPVEARAGVRVFGERWALTAASGAGLSDGYGAPDVRVLVAFAFAPGQLDGPRPLPGRRVTGPAPPPRFPEAPSLLDPVVFDDATRADPDPDGDGVLAGADACPESAEDHDGFMDDDGCPDPDNDGDGVPDTRDLCPDALEVPNGVMDDDGCPDEGQAMVVARDGVIELAQSVEFNSGSDVLARSAAPLLSEVAAVLKANPHIRRVRIEGHTDDQGDEEMNVDLSERRASSVRARLVELGVEPTRLLPRGYGATRPVASNATPEGRRKNRRVDFRIIDPPAPGTPRIELDEVPP